MNSPIANDWPVIDAFLARETYRSAVSSNSACCQDPETWRDILSGAVLQGGCQSDCNVSSDSQEK
ncbi:hypothetical protein TMatcc_003886 [Talaromyces marneffei ATCC 18224]